ncbi:putative ribonuclease H-like domain-containing protein [Tanacetum coccineum]
MAKQAELNNSMKSSQREIRPIWNNVQRVNHKNQFVPTSVLIRTGKILVNTARASGTNKVSTARHDFNRHAILTNAAMKVNTVKPLVNRVRPANVFYKTHSPFSRPFINTTALRTKFSYQKVNIVEVNAVSAVGGKRKTADYPHRALKHKGIIDSGCSRYMTRNKAYLAAYQDFNGGPVAFGGSKGYITGKGTKDNIDAGDSEKEDESAQDYFVLPIWSSYSSTVKRSTEKDAGTKRHRKMLNVAAGSSQISPYGKKAIGTKWVYRNKKDERGVVVRNKARIEGIRIFLAFASYMGFIVYQMDVKSAFLYGKIDEEVYVSQPPGFIDPIYPQKVYRVVKALYGLHQAPRASYATLSTFLLKNRYRRGTIDKTLFIKKDKHDIIFVQVYVDDIIFGSTENKRNPCQDKYVAEILKKFDFVSVKTASTPIETQKPLVKDEAANDVDVHLYRSMIGSLMYLTASRPDIMFAVFACSRFQQTIVATSTTEAEYVAAANCCGQVLWIQNEMLDYGFNFMNTKIYIDNESTICIVKNPVYHSKTKHIAIRHHFIRDAYEKKLIQVLKIHTDDNVADLLTKAFDVSRFQFLVCAEAFLTIGDGFQEVHWVFKSHWEEIKTLEKTKGNADFHEVIDFLARSYIHHALTVSPVVSTTFVKQFWMSAKSKIINNVRYITAKVAGKPVSISEASIRSDLLFDDADGIDSLPNQAIFDAIQPRLANVPVPLDHFPVNALTSKVFSFMVKKGKHFSGKVTPLFASMLVQSIEDEGATSERPSEPQPTPSPPHPSKANVEPQSDPSPRPSPTPHITDSIPEVSGGNHGGQSSSDKSLSGNEGKKSLKSNWMQKESVSKQGRKSAKAEPSVHKDPLFDELDDDEIDNMETEDAQDVGRTRDGVNAKKEGTKDAVSTEDVVSTDKEKVSTDRLKVSTDRSKVSNDRSKDSTDKEKEGTDKEKEGNDKDKDSTVSLDEGIDDRTEARSDTPTTPTTTLTTTPIMFGDDKTIAQVLLNKSQAKAVSREKEKGVELKDVEESEKPRPTSTRSLLTLKPLPKIDPKDKGKKKIEEEDESDTDIRDIPESWKQQFTVEERAKFLYDTIAAQRRFLAEQRAIAITNRPPTRSQLRNQMMTYLKHVGNKKHSDLKNKAFEEIQALYEKVKRFNESFTAVGSTEDERKIKEMNEGAKDLEQKRLKKKVSKETPKKEDTAKVPAKVDVKEQGTKKRKGGHMKMIARKRKRPQPNVDSNDEHRECLKIVTFEGTIDSEIMERKYVIARLNKVSSPDGDYLVIYRANGNFRAFNGLLEVLHIFDRQDLFHLYDLVMEQYSEITLEGIELILWGDLKIMMESSTEENDQSDFWNDQQDWEIVTWRLYEACGVYILELKDGTVIHMLVERRYPLSKDLLQRMLDLGLEVERESTAALDLIRFIKQQIDEK